jgi:hypothetical protein
MTDENARKIISLLSDIESNQDRSSADKDDILKVLVTIADTLADIDSNLSELRQDLKNNT